MVGLPFTGEHPFGYVRGDPDALDLEAAERAWTQLRDELLAECEAGQRPWGWWCFEAGEPHPIGGGREAARLIELGEATPADRTALRRWLESLAPRVHLLADGQRDPHGEVEEWTRQARLLRGAGAAGGVVLDLLQLLEHRQPMMENA